MSDSRGQPASREFVFRTIRLLMLVDIGGGGVLVLLGLFVLDFPALAIAGAFLAAMGVGLFVLMTMLMRRAAAGATADRSGPHELRR